MGAQEYRVRTRVRRADATHPMSDIERLNAPTRVNKIGAVTEYADTQVKREQEITQVELLLLKGFRTPSSIMGMLGFDRTKTDNYIRLAMSRWEITGGNKNFEARRGEQVARIHTLMQEAWVMYQNAGGEENGNDLAAVKVKRSLLITIGSLNKQLSELHGITARSVSRQMLTSTDRGDIVKRMQKQDQMASIASMLADLIKKRKGDDAKDITVEANEVEA